MNITVDVDALRDYMDDYAGSAAFSGFPAAMLDVIDNDSLGAQALCRKAERMGIDLRDFAVAADDDSDDFGGGGFSDDDWDEW